MKFHVPTIMSKESAQWIGNSLYSIMMGFALSFALFKWNLEEYSSDIEDLSIIIFLYYLLDWMSYNAILDYDPKQEHLQVFFTIIFILMLGWLLTLANHINATLLANHINGTLVSLYSLVSSVYLSVSTVLGVISLWLAYKEQESKEHRVANFSDFVRNFKLGVPDVIARISVALVLLILCIFHKSTTMLIWRHFIVLAAFSTILLTKYVRYQFLLCKLVREAKRADHRVKTKLIICPLIRKASMTRKEVKENLMYCPVANQLDKNKPEAKK